MRRRGFTLVEILLIVMIMALASTLVGLEVYRNMDRTALRASTQRLLHTARYARVLAAQHHRQCTLHVDMDNGTYWLTALETNVPLVEVEGEEGGDEGAQVIRSICARPSKLPEKLWFAKARVAGGEDATGEVTITFEPDGSAEAALVQISSEDDTQTLLVYPWTAKSVLVAGAIDELPTDVVDEGRGGSASVRYR